MGITRWYYVMFGPIFFRKIQVKYMLVEISYKMAIVRLAAVLPANRLTCLELFVNRYGFDIAICLLPWPHVFKNIEPDVKIFSDVNVNIHNTHTYIYISILSLPITQYASVHTIFVSHLAWKGSVDEYLIKKLCVSNGLSHLQQLFVLLTPSFST